MIDLGMIKWYAERCIGTDTVWTDAVKKALENIDRGSLRLLLNAQYGLLPTQADYMVESLIWQELQRQNKEEKKMHKKQKVNGHVVHKLPKCENIYYTVDPENGRIAVYRLKYDEGTGEPHYYEYGRMNICAKQLGRHGYLQEQINWLIQRYSENEDLKALNNTVFKEEKKMKNKKYYSGSVAVKTWRTRKTFNDLDDITSNSKTDLITFREGRYMGAMYIPGGNIPIRLPIDKSKRYTKEEITEAITTAWDKGEYAADQTDIRWIFNPDPEGFTGTVDLATVLLKCPKGIPGHADTRVSARCRVRIVDGTFFEKLDGSSKLADILENHKGIFETKKDIETYIENKWHVEDFGNDASYYTLEIEED